MELINNNALDELRMMDEEGGFLKEIVNLFITDSVNTLNDIKNHAASGDIGAMNKSAHKLKGSSLSIGAQALGELCFKLEKTESFSSDDEKEQNMKDLQSLYDQSVEALQKIIA
ncbi:MAG: Hpt domain-containing protein [Bacteroidetes bacterium]|nr:Hpt domain-containing protein [Bacteroidota bacterium]